MSIDPWWLKNFQSKQESINIAVSDYMVCMELEEGFKEPFEEDQYE